jgi:hypothetical protein
MATIELLDVNKVLLGIYIVVLSRLFLLVDAIVIILFAVWFKYYGHALPLFSWVIGVLGLLPLFGAVLLRADESDEGESSS